MKWLKKLFGGGSDDSAVPAQDAPMADAGTPDMTGGGEAESTEE